MVDPLLPTLPVPLNWLDDSARSRRVIAAGNYVFQQGQSCRGCFFLQRGVVQMQRVSERGTQTLIHQVASGESFAEASLFQTHYHCAALVTRDSTIVECSKAAILERLKQDSAFALALTERFAEQVQEARVRLEILSIPNAEERVYQAVSVGLLKDSLKSLAETIGLSQEAVYRALSSLTRSGRLRKVGYGKYEL